MQKIWIYYHGDHNVGGGGATVKVYSSAENAIRHNSGNWELKAAGLYELVDSELYEPISIYEVEVDSNEIMTSDWLSLKTRLS